MKHYVTLEDPVQPTVGVLLADALTKDPAGVVGGFKKSEQSHIYVKQMVKDTVHQVMTTREFISGARL